MEQVKKENRGGVRPNSGRPAISPEERQARAEAKRQILLDELVFPALAAALNTVTKGYDKHLEVALSAKQIEMAYGAEGLTEWKSYFTCVKAGGFSTEVNTAYVSRWKLNPNKQILLQKMLKSVGKSVADLPIEFFPPQAMTDRVNAVIARRDAKRLKKMNVIWDAMETPA